MKRLMACIIVLMMMSGSAWAWDAGYHVKQAPNGKGDLMIFPMFFAAGDWETKLTVINTSPEYSVIAKVVYRSHYWTEELLDHLIYLSPNDVWVGYVRDIGGVPTLYSTDDSILVGDGVFASTTNPVSQPLYPVDCASDSNERGYVEVIETWYYDTVSPVAKTVLHGMYNHMNGPVTATDVAGYVNAAQSSDGVDHTINVLSGLLEFQNRNMMNYVAAMTPQIFADFDITEYLTVIAASGLDEIFSYRNTLGEVEAALAKNDIAMPYINSVENGRGTIHMFNFPTKQAYGASCAYSPDGPFWQQHDVNGDGTITTADQCVTYTGTFYDLSENQLTSSTLYSGGTVTSATMCEELEWIVIYGGSYFTEGWQRYTFDTTPRDLATYYMPAGAPSANYEGSVPLADIIAATRPSAVAPIDYGYYGIPVIPFGLYLNGTGLELFKGADTDGEVYASWVAAAGAVDLPTAGTWLPDYQYWNYMNALGLNDNTGIQNGGLVGNGWYPVNATGISFPAQALLP